VAQAVAALREEGPTLGRPLVDRLKRSGIHHLKELRPGSGGRSEVRIIFAFDPAWSALLLLGGDKAGNWQRWYRDNIPLAEQPTRCDSISRPIAPTADSASAAARHCA
jgi:hypothetical protein